MALRTIPTSLLLAVVLTPATGCYSGLDGGSPAADGDGGPADDGANDGDPNREPSVPGSEAPFRVPDEEARMLPFPVRMQNLSHVTGQPLEHPMYLELFELRYQLGDHDFAEGVAPDLRWSAEAMQYWVRGLRPVCADPAMSLAYPDLLTDPRALMRTAWGREPTLNEVEAIGSLQSTTVLPQDHATLTCIAVLTALDFVSI